MDNKEDKITDIEPILTDSLDKNIIKAVSISTEYSKMLCESCVPMIESMIEPLNQLTRNIIDSVNCFVNSAAFSVINECINSVVNSTNWSSIAHSLFELYNDTYLQESIYNISKAGLDLFAEYDDIINSLDSLTDDEIEQLLIGTEFTTEEVLDGIREIKEEFISSDISDKMLLKDKWECFLRNHPALANLIFMMTMMIALATNMITINDAGDLVVSATQEVIVSMQGNEDIFFIKVESAKLYTEPSSHSAVIMNIFYGEQVDLVESQKLWDKVIYINQDGEEIIGWIAKRNLMTYQDYQFNSDDLYDMK